MFFAIAALGVFATVLYALVTASQRKKRVEKGKQLFASGAVLGPKLNVCVIGAGMAGLGYAKMFKKHGHTVTVLEKSDKVGGVWQTAYPGVRLQAWGDDYCFSDFPRSYMWNHPTAKTVCRYLEEYKDFFKIDVTFDTTVTRLERVDVDGSTKWRVHSTDKEETASVTQYDYVVYAIGVFGHEPHIPEQFRKENRIVDGVQMFDDSVQLLHNADYKDRSQIEGKNVVVVGFGRSALAIAGQAGTRGKHCYHVFRQARWQVPKHIFGIHYTNIFGTKFGCDPIPWYSYNTLQKMFASIPSFQTNFLANIEKVISFHLGTKEGDDLQPAAGSLASQLRSASALVAEGYFESLRKGDLTAIKGEIVSWKNKTVTLNNGRKLENVDVVICGTGYTFSNLLLPACITEKYDLVKDGGLQLYRHAIHPDLPNIAFAGHNVSFMSVLSVELTCLWQLAAIRGDVQLPSAEKQREEIKKVADWKKANTIYEKSRANGVNVRYFNYHETLLNDMGISPVRKPPVIDYFQRYPGRDYLDLDSELLAISKWAKGNPQKTRTAELSHEKVF